MQWNKEAGVFENLDFRIRAVPQPMLAFSKHFQRTNCFDLKEGKSFVLQRFSLL